MVSFFLTKIKNSSTKRRELRKGVFVEDPRPVYDVELIKDVARSIADVFIKHPLVLAVALTGSGAREGEPIHDIDLVILTDESCVGGSLKVPSSFWESYIPAVAELEEIFYQELEAVCAKHRGIPLDLMFVQASALWDCSYLQSLRPHERFKDFFLRLFVDTETPLMLLCADLASADGISTWMDDNGLAVGSSYAASTLKHHCADPKCIPTISWQQAKDEAVARKARVSDYY